MQARRYEGREEGSRDLGSGGEKKKKKKKEGRGEKKEGGKQWLGDRSK